MITRGKGAGRNLAVGRGGFTGTNFARMYSHDIDFQSIGHKLRIERGRMGYTQEQTAEVIGITPAFVGHIERGERSMSLDTLIHFCNLYHVTIDYLLSDTLPQNDDNTLTQIADILKDMLPEQQTALLDILKTLIRHI